MKRIHSKKIVNLLGKFLFLLITFLFFSVKYYMKCWNVDFATAMYQMSSPLKGTNPQYFMQYAEVAAVPCILFLVG